MKATVCELPNTWTRSDLYWEKLAHHLAENASDLLVLPEMPFFEWITRSDAIDPDLWQQSVEAHDAWTQRLAELPVAMTIASRPVMENKRKFNRGFVFTREQGVVPVHDKYYLPDEPGYYEASWYDRGDGTFDLVHINGLAIGFLICTELWFTNRARQYLAQNVDILVCPRATPKTRVDIWVTGGRSAAIVSGAFCLSSNYNGPNTRQEDFGGTGWIIEPERGDVLGITSPSQNFLTLEIDINDARTAKKTYPRYVRD